MFLVDVVVFMSSKILIWILWGTLCCARKKLAQQQDQILLCSIPFSNSFFSEFTAWTCSILNMCFASNWFCNPLLISNPAFTLEAHLHKDSTDMQFCFHSSWRTWIMEIWNVHIFLFSVAFIGSYPSWSTYMQESWWSCLQGYDCMVKANGKLEKEVLSLEVCFLPFFLSLIWFDAMFIFLILAYPTLLAWELGLKALLF